MISQRLISALAETDISPHLAKAIMVVVEAAEKIALYPQGAHDPPPNEIEWSMAEIAQVALSELEQALKDAGL